MMKNCLVQVVKYLVTSGTFKADNGFKPGFLTVVQEKLKFKLPNSSIKAQPHINSRLRHFKNVHAIVSDMVVGHSTFGFGWHFEKKTVTAEKDLWKEYLQSHKKVVEFKSKPCPYYEDLCIIFGRDRASGAESRGVQDVEDDINEEEPSKRDFESSSTQGLPERIEASTLTSGRGRRVRAGEQLTKSLVEVATTLGKEIREASSETSHALGFDVVLSEKRLKRDEEVAKLGLNMKDRHRGIRKIGNEAEFVVVFFGIPDVEKREWDEALLFGDF